MWVILLHVICTYVYVYIVYVSVWRKSAFLGGLLLHYGLKATRDFVHHLGN